MTPAAAPRTIACSVTRASTCMGDDATAPHERNYPIAVAPDDPAPVQACLKTIALDYGYVPSVIGGSTWVARIDGAPVAVVVRRADRETAELRLLTTAPLPEEAPAALTIHFDYLLNVDPDRLAAQLEAGERPERIYTPDAPWMGEGPKPPPPCRPRKRRLSTGTASTRPNVAPFAIRGSGALSRLRVRRRWASASLGDGILRFTLPRGRVLDFPVDRIRRILVGREPYRSGTGHRLKIWPEGERSLILTAFADQPEMPDYAALLRGLAAELEQQGALGRMRLGLPRFRVFGLPLLIFVCLFGAIWFAAWSEGNGPATVQEHLLMALAIAVIALIPTALTLRQGFHRRVRSLADLDRLLAPH